MLGKHLPLKGLSQNSGDLTTQSTYNPTSVPYEPKNLDQSLKGRNWDRSSVLKLQQVSALMHGFLGPATELFIQKVWVGAWEYAFLRRSHQMLLVEAILKLLTLRILSNSNVLYFMYLQFL